MNIDNLASSARISLTVDEKIRLAEDLNKITSHFADVSEVNYSAGECVTDHTFLRDDEPSECENAGELINCAPTKADGFIAVPRVVGGEADE